MSGNNILEVTFLKKAYLLDDGILLKGMIKYRFFKKVFIPQSNKCGFHYQQVWKRDIGKTLFFSEIDIKAAGLDQLRIVE